ncbi:MAG: DMT family transporter [Pseudomonadota bacterium]
MTTSAAKSLFSAAYQSPPMLLTLTALFWAGNAIAGNLAAGEVSPMFLTFLRWSLVSAALWALFGRQTLAYWPVLKPKLLSLVLMASFGFAIFNGFLYTASLSTTAINIGIMQGSMPVLVLAGAYLLQNAPLSRLQALGVAITIAGVVVVASQGAPHKLLEIGLNPGDALMFCACLCYAGYALALKDRPQIPGLLFFTAMAPVAALVSIPMAATEYALGYFQAPTPFGWALALWIAVFPSFLSQIFFLRGVDLIGPGRAGVYINLVPVFAAILAVLILDQRFAGFHAAALLLVLAGLWIAQRPSAQRD